MTVFGDVNVSVYGNSDVLKFTFTFKCVLLENQKCNYFNHILYIAALYLLFIPVSFIKFNPLSLSWYFLQNSRKVLFEAATSQSGKQLNVPRLYIILLGTSNSQLIGSHTMKRVCLKLKRAVLESQINYFFCCFHSFVFTCLFGPTLTLGDILVIIAYTQKPRENVDADIHVSSGDRGLNSIAIYHLHSYFTLTSLYIYTDFPESRVLVAGQCDKYQTLTYWLIVI